MGGIKYNLDPLKIFYYLLKDIKSKHKLNDKNCNRLAIFIRIVELMKLSDQHNKAAIEVNKVNMILRRTTAFSFVVYAFLKIISLFIIRNMNDILLKFITINIFCIALVFGFGMSFLFSQQIKSAHKSYRLIHSIVCNYKMRLPIKLKVS